MLLSVIIVNYNVKYFLEQCLCSVQKACIGIESEIIVVDNNSTDGSREWLEQKFTQVKFIWQTNNNGFGKANNYALKTAQGAYLLFLNPDTIIAEDSLLLCLNEMKKNETIGALGVRMIDGSGKFLKESKRGFPTAGAAFFKMSGFSSLFPTSKTFAHYYLGHLKQHETNDVDILAGAFMMLSRKTIEITKGFDEDFFMYGEDVDLSYRIQKAGLQNVYFAGTTIIHFKGESTQRFSTSYNQHFYGAMKLFVKKHFSDKKAMLFLTGLAITGGRMLASFKTLFAQRKTDTSSAKPLNTAIAAGQQKFDECLQLVKFASPPLAIAGRIAVRNGDTGTALGRMENIVNILSKYKINQLIFCEKEQSFKMIIQQAEKIPVKTEMLFHAAGSSCMVGSSNKNSKGKFISKPEGT
ncbi:MAG: glycosyltransferase family 2 protein [Rhizobacter sp.]|nr:glycosyltransferase family 2 protein [Ferruginibacter sp.]